jgi:hypothetical protein
MDEFQNSKLKDSLARVRKDSIESENQKSSRSSWTNASFVDDFGDPTKSKYIKTNVEGVFSNSATFNAPLFAEVLLTNDAAAIFLREYNRASSPANFIGTAQVQLKNENGKKIIIRCYLKWNQRGGIRIENEMDTGFPTRRMDYLTLRDFIKKSTGKIKVAIFDKYSSEYHFTIDNKGFEEALISLK